MKNQFITSLLLVVPFLIFSQTVPIYIPTNGLVAWYPFNNNANDESSNGNNGVVNGATLTTDRSGNANSAYSFNGTIDYITVMNSPALSLVDSASFSFWMKWNGDNGIGGASQTMIDKSTPSNIENYRVAVEEPIASLPNRVSALSNSVELHSNSTYDTITWIHTVVTFQSGIVKIYKNGVLDNVGSVSLTAVNSDDLLIGQSSQIGFHFFFGKLDDIAIWNRALTPCEVKQVYMSGNSGLTLSASMLSYCLSDGQGTLTGSPTGGTWSGPGVTGISFDPAIADTGTHFVTYTYTDSTGCTTSDSLQLTVNLCTSLNQDAAYGNTISIFPNPVVSGENVQINHPDNTRTITVLDIAGREIWRADALNNSRLLQLSISEPGTYFIRVENTSGDLIVEPLIVQ